MESDFFKALKMVHNNIPGEISPDIFIPVMSTLSGNVKNIPIVDYCNKAFFTTDKQVLFELMKKQRTFWGGKRPKKLEEDIPKHITLAEKYLKKLYGWSSAECRINRDMITREFAQVARLIDNHFGLNKQECKILGIDYKDIKVDKKLMKQEKGATSLSDFM